MIELGDVEAAAKRLAGVAHRTPVFTSRTLDERVGARVHVKAECFQRGGAFKFRGAYNKVSSLDEESLRRGVVAVYTLWQPKGWRATNGLRLGATPLQVHNRAGRLHTITCDGYDALVTDSPDSRTAYYLYNGSLWAFGLFLPHWSPCR